MQRNPYLVALLAITIGIAVVAAILLIVGTVQNGAYESYLERTNPSIITFTVAGQWIGYALVSLMVTLLAGAVAWKAPAASSS